MTKSFNLQSLQTLTNKSYIPPIILSVKSNSPKDADYNCPIVNKRWNTPDLNPPKCFEWMGAV